MSPAAAAAPREDRAGRAAPRQGDRDGAHARRRGPAAAGGTVRIDDSVMRLLGEGLVELGQEIELLPDNHTYGSRHPRGASLPGILVDGLRVVA